MSKSINRNSYTELLADTADRALEQVFDDLDSSDYKRIFPDKWQVYTGGNPATRDMEVVMNVKNKGVPDWDEVFQKLGEKRESMDNRKLNGIWNDAVREKFENVYNSDYQNFEYEDFIITGRSGGYWGVVFDKGAFLRIEVAKWRKAVGSFLSTDEGRELIEKYADDKGNLDGDIVEEICDSIDNKVKKEALELEPSVKSDLVAMGNEIEGGAKSLESTSYWVGMIKDEGQEFLKYLKIASSRGKLASSPNWKQPIKIEMQKIDDELSKIFVVAKDYDKYVVRGNNIDNEVFKQKIQPLIDKILRIVEVESWSANTGITSAYGRSKRTKRTDKYVRPERNQWKRMIRVEMEKIDEEISKVYLSGDYEKTRINGKSIDNEVFKEKVQPLIDKIFTILEIETW